MNSLLIASTEDSPSVNIDTATNCCVISGASRPENAKTFYSPLLNWLTEYKTLLDSRKPELTSKPLTFIFKLEYFNSASAKVFIDILLELKEIGGKGHPIKVEWHYDKRDEDMYDTGKEFSMAVGIKFHYTQY